MRVTTKGQVTIPKYVRDKMGITPNCEIDFAEKDGKFFLTKKKINKQKKDRFARFKGIATIKMSTDEIMALTRS